jgi:hypothetical protein
MSTWLWVLIGAVAFLVLIVLTNVLMARLEERKLEKDPDFMQRLVRERNAAALTNALQHSWSPKTSAQAADALGRLRDASAIPTLLDAYLQALNSAIIRRPCARALAAMPGEQVVPLVLAKLGGGRDAILIELLREFDLPAANEVVDKFDKEAAEARERIDRRRQIVDGLLKDAAERPRTELTIPIPVQFGVAGKIVGGMVTGGMVAASASKLSLDGLVHLPEVCVLCGCLPGETQCFARCTFQFASAGWHLVGVSTSGEALFPYSICSKCHDADEKWGAVKISLETDEQESWYVHLHILNPEVARQVRDLNACAPHT